MRKFLDFYDNGKYHVGCNGGTIYVYDKNGAELTKFKDIKYAYSGVFKPNTNLFYNIEKPDHSTATQLTVYDGSDFTKIASYFANDRKMVLDHIEVYPDEIYLLGFIRGGDGVFDYGFVSKYADGKITGLKEIKSAEYAIDNYLQKWAKRIINI